MDLVAGKRAGDGVFGSIGKIAALAENKRRRSQDQRRYEAEYPAVWAPR
jgi:hypothetical protein